MLGSNCNKIDPKDETRRCKLGPTRNPNSKHGFDDMFLPHEGNCEYEARPALLVAKYEAILQKLMDSLGIELHSHDDPPFWRRAEEMLETLNIGYQCILKTQIADRTTECSKLACENCKKAIEGLLNEDKQST